MTTSGGETQPPRVRVTFERAAIATLQPVAMALAALYALLTPLHALLLEPAARMVMAPLAATSAVGLALGAWALGRWPPSGVGSHALGAVLALVVTANSLVHLAVVGAPYLATNVVLLLVGCGVLFTSGAWYAGVAAISIVGWLGISLRGGLAAEEIHYGIALGEALMLGTVVFVVRMRTLATLERLHREQAERAEHLVRLSDELRRKNRDLDQFAAIVAHDLKQPLGTAAMAVDVILEEIPSPSAEVQEFSAMLLGCVARMRGMVDGLLEFSRATEGGSRRVSVDPRVVIEEVLASMASTVRDAGAVVDLDDLPTVVASPEQLAHVFQNLIGNAIRYRSESTPRIRIEGLPSGVSTTFRVIDNGLGVPEDRAESIFEMFDRGDQDESRPGSGVGLAICRKIVERHGGRIWVEPGLAGGSQFAFTIEPPPAPIA